MEYLDAIKETQGGFNFDNCTRNTFMVNNKLAKEPTATSTGTTIVGCIFKDGVMLAADTRATNGEMIAD